MKDLLKDTFENLELAKIIAENIADGVYIVDQDRKLLYWNKASEKISGFTTEEVVGRHCFDNILMHVNDCGDELCTSKCSLAKTLEDGLHRESSIYLHHKNGHRVPVRVKIAPIVAKDGSIAGALESFVEIPNKEDLVLKVEELEKTAYLDHLTQIANRAYIDNMMESKISEFERYGWNFGFMIIDIDKFKNFNDTYGHQIGDEVLKMVASSLKANVRPFDMAGRWGGEEFVVVAANIDYGKLMELAERLRMLVEHSYREIDGNKLAVTISIGVAMCNKADTIASLTKRADDRLYKAKENGRNRVVGR